MSLLDVSVTGTVSLGLSVYAAATVAAGERAKALILVTDGPGTGKRNKKEYKYHIQNDGNSDISLHHSDRERA